MAQGYVYDIIFKRPDIFTCFQLLQSTSSQHGVLITRQC